MGDRFGERLSEDAAGELGREVGLHCLASFWLLAINFFLFVKQAVV